MKRVLYKALFSFMLSTFFVRGQDVELMDKSFNVKGVSETSFFFGFAADDELKFYFQTIDGEKLGEVEVREPGGISFYSVQNTGQASREGIRMLKTSIVEFRFKNVATLGRACKLRIVR